MQGRDHEVTVRVDGQEVGDWVDYQITCDMLSPADSFSMTVAPASKALFDLLAPNKAVEVRIDGTVVLNGYIDERRRHASRSQGSTLQITGRDKGGRLIDESMPLATGLRQLTLRDLARKVAEPWFSEVVFNNGANRSAIRGRRAAKAAAWNEPTSAELAAEKKRNLSRYQGQDLGGLFETPKEAPKKVEPGQSRWDVLASVLEPARFLAWSTADGRQLVVGVPNYDQRPQFQFFLAASSTSERRGYTNVLTWDHVATVADRYSEVQVLGTSRGNESTYGSALDRDATVRDARWTGAIKCLVVQDDEIKNAADAKARAWRELALREMHADVITVMVDGHGQRYNAASAPALYAFDTVADLLDEETGVGGRWYVTSVEFSGSKDEGETTMLTLVPIHTELAL